MRKLAIITGGSKGIGECLVRSLLLEMSILNISRSALPKAIGSAGYEVHNMCLDLADTVRLERELTSWLTNHPDYEVPIFIGNAATLKLGWLEDVTAEEFQAAFAVNALAPITISNTLTKLNRFSLSGARVVFVTSSLARNQESLSFAGIGLYSATKAALGRLASVLRREFKLKAATVTVTQVHPGVVDTSMQADLRSNTSGDPAFVEKNANLPHYREGEWEGVSPAENMRTIPPRLAADFLLWVTNVPGEALDNEYDFYTCGAFHQRKVLGPNLNFGPHQAIPITHRPHLQDAR